ncbi:MAG: acetylglutamate kinase [Candidatus Omnitrophica bacterium]|nr:acetylglutamate kinase [Candidatus Omnitrophota bacterium]MBU1127983.1 acetylglutamate kinase [Candidatus Omnitrophota bacterium]MBU1656696.1 acetylglutamate kinase [Candidatus Omnitrophota bacterium]MBU1784862.1 acetylglutamate kinase [Candidatus Omnitrophota bacterium]MBU1851696.1 acetylglutamate kinase [Candidatus Omnitrophota bacterium]
MEEAIKKSAVLIEALPYIKKFFNKVVVIKYGGSYLHEEEVRSSVLRDIVFMRYAGMKPVLVHGGGPDISKRLEAESIETRFVDGLRVTCERSMVIVDSVLTGINDELVGEINSHGGEAFGLSGKENNMIRVVPALAERDLGYVGKVDAIDTTVIKRLTETNVIPVICPVGKGADGKPYNINADETASSLAVALDAEKFVLMTNVVGVMEDKDAPQSLYHSLTSKKVQALIKEGVIAGGMLPKVTACLYAIKGGVRKAHIVSAGLQHALLLEIFTDTGIGTEITK